MTRRSLLMQPIQAAPSAYALTCRGTVSRSPGAVNAGRKPLVKAEARWTADHQTADRQSRDTMRSTLPGFRPSGSVT